MTADTANLPGFDLTSSGVTLANSSFCKEYSCAYFSPGSFLMLPAHNYADHPGLSFSVWFFNTDDTADARIFDLGHGQGLQNVMMARHELTDKMDFAVTKTGGVFLWTSHGGVWKTNEWRHVVWVMDPIAESGKAWWTIYFDGELAGKMMGLYPETATLASAFLAKSNLQNVGHYVGYMDSLYILPSALGWNEAHSMYTVSSCLSSWLSMCIQSELL